MPGEIVGGELGRHPAPAERQPRPDHRDLGAGVPDPLQQVGEQARQPEADEHQRDRQLLGAVGGAARWRKHARADHADHDRAHREVLVAARVLVQHALGQEHQHQQSRRQRRLHHHERGEQQRHHLKRPTEDRQAGSEQPASAPDQPPDERQAQVLGARSLLGVHRLEGDP